MRPTGDFGRSADSLLHDEVMPYIGEKRAEGAGEPVSTFNMSDQETEMRDRVWRYLEAPHAGDWQFDMGAELKRTRIAPMSKFKGEVPRYYQWLTGESYASSRVRYNRITDDATADIDTLPTTFQSICAVREVDRQRQVAEGNIDGLEPAMQKESADRRAENDMVVGWFTLALNYRYDSYSFALDHLLVETPHEQAVGTDAALSDLAIYVEAANRGDFCSGMSGQDGNADGVITSRYSRPSEDEGPYRK
ncbi:MAG: hypothetical protein ABL879_04860 [Devosia sp.]